MAGWLGSPPARVRSQLVDHELVEHVGHVGLVVEIQVAIEHGDRDFGGCRRFRSSRGRGPRISTPAAATASQGNPNGGLRVLVSPRPDRPTAMARMTSSITILFDLKRSAAR